MHESGDKKLNHQLRQIDQRHHHRLLTSRGCFSFIENFSVGKKIFFFESSLLWLKSKRKGEEGGEREEVLGGMARSKTI